MNQQGRPPWPSREKRYDWFRVYNDFVGHPKFRYVAKQCQATVSEVCMIALALFVSANKSRPRGWVRDFDPFECSAALDIEAETVVRVFRAFEELDWIDQDYLATWDKRQPDKEDPTAADRQRRRRDKLKQARAGTRPKAAEQGTIAAAHSDEVGVQYWLFTDGLQIVAGRIGEKTLASELRLKRWLTDVGKDAEALVEIIRSAAAANLTGDAFRNLVSQRADEVRRRRTLGPPLPLGTTVVKGGAA